MKLKTKLGK